MKKFLLAIALMAFGTTVSFGQNAPVAKTEKTAKTKKSKSEKKSTATAMYECPMKCEPASKTAGKCSKCGMDLVAVKPKK